jgi:Carboxypeptidase regulatory-like domain/TonB dependent receptor-like, beta-barrel
MVAALLFLAAGAGLRPAFAQPAAGSLHGTTTAVSPDGLVFTATAVDVRLVPTTPGQAPLTVQSDENGAYKFESVPPGNYSLEASEQGFKPFKKPVTVRADESTVENIRLSLETLKQQIQVQETAPPVFEQNTTPPAKLTSPQLNTAPVAEQKVKEELPLMPGVIRAPNEKTYIKGDVESQGMLEIDSTQTVDPVTGSYLIDLPIDAVESLNVYKAVFTPEDGGYTGGLTSIDTKAPSDTWQWGMNNVNPKIRAKQGHWVGFQQAEPRLYFTGPILTKKLDFSEAFQYTFNRVDIRGLAWPNDETKIQGFNSFSKLQYLFSDHHLMTFNVRIYPRRQEFANLRALTPQPATSDYGQKGYSIGGADHYQFSSGGNLSTLFQFAKIDTWAHGQGSADMLITPNGLAGNSFNAWRRYSHQEEASAIYSFPQKDWLGKHEIKIGADVIHRDFKGSTESHPVELLRADGSVAERIDFTGGGSLDMRTTQTAGFVQDHWVLNDHVALDGGLRYFGQSIGEKTDFAPRLGLVLSPGRDGKTVFRASAGVFYDRFPLLGGDFTNNPERIVSLFGAQGVPSGPSEIFSNVCAERAPAGPHILTSCADMNSTPYNTSWQVEADHRFPHQLLVRFSYLSSRTFNEFVVTPALSSSGGPLLMLINSGHSRYHDVEVSVRYHPSDKADITFAYLHSRSRGDLNTVSEIYVPFEQPVIRPDTYTSLYADVPDRLTALGTFHLPWQVTLVPAVDLHTGFPYSNVDVFQNYAGIPNGLRYPTYFSLNWSIFREFPVPFHKGHKFRFGVYSVNTTSRQNPNDVYNNIASPLFGTFTGLDKRVNGIIIGFAQ